MKREGIGLCADCMSMVQLRSKERETSYSETGSRSCWFSVGLMLTRRSSVQVYMIGPVPGSSN